MARLERLFRRYQRKHDVAALAAVFDEAAPEVLRLALHFSGNLELAEELLQETFLTAINKAEQFDGTRRLMPWLVGILGHLARNARRKASRTPDSERMPLRAVPPADAHAEQDEVGHAAWAALDALREPYREVLVLHLRHGLSVSAVAHVLDRAPATVRSQLSRGLEQVRGGLSERDLRAARAWIPAGVGLASVRASIVQHASQVLAPSIGVAATATAAATIGGLVGTKHMLAAAALVSGLALAGGMALWSDSSSQRRQPASDAHTLLDSESATSSDKPAALLATSAADADSRARSPNTPSLSQGPMPDIDEDIASGQGQVEGTLRFADGTPLSELRVRLWDSPDGFSTTDKQGRYLLESEPVGVHALVVVDNHGDEVVFIPGQVTVLDRRRVTFDATLKKGYVLQGTAHSAHNGDAITGGTVVIRSKASNRQASYASCKVNNDARFDVPYIPAGRYSIQVEKRRFESHFGHIEVGPDMAEPKILLQVARPIELRFEGLASKVDDTEVHWSFQAIGRHGHFTTSGSRRMNARGELEIDAPPPGAYIFSIQATEHTARVVLSPYLVPPKGPIKPVFIATVTLASASGRLHLPVRLEPTELLIGPKRARVDAEGRFSVTDLPAGRHPIWLPAGRCHVLVGEIEAKANATASQDINVPGKAELRMKIDCGAGEEAIGALRRGRTQVAMIRAAHDEVIRLPYLAGGTYHMMLLKNGRKQINMPFEVATGGVTDLGTIVMIETPPIQLTVAMADESYPPAGLVVAFQPGADAGPHLPAARMSSRRLGTLQDLAVGRYLLTFTLPQCHPVDKTIEVSKDAPAIELIFDRK